jgi:hypothetical protein
MQPGMISSIEPGTYRPGSGGTDREPGGQSRGRQQCVR